MRIWYPRLVNTTKVHRGNVTIEMYSSWLRKKVLGGVLVTPHGERYAIGGLDDLLAVLKMDWPEAVIYLRDKGMPHGT